MVLGTIEIFALIVSVIALVKILVILIKPKAWMSVVKSVWSAPNLVMVICLVLAAIVFYYLIQTLTIVQIMAVVLFVALLSGMTIAVYSKELVALASKMLSDRKFLGKAWLAVIIWLILIIWALKDILF